LGAVYAVVLSRLFGPTADPPLKVIFVISFFATLTASFSLGQLVTPVWIVGPFVLAGICGGVVANAIYDGVIHHVDHNLFPFEIVLMSVFAMPGVMAGLTLAWFMRRHLE
jgi:hypothetical protein